MDFRAGGSRVTIYDEFYVVALVVFVDRRGNCKRFEWIMDDEDILRVSLPPEGTYDLEIRTSVQVSTALEYKVTTTCHHSRYRRQTVYTQ